MSKFVPRDWQVEFLQTALFLKNKGQSDCILVACPGAGKTKAVLHLYNTLKARGDIDRLIFITYTEYLKHQVAEAGHQMGINLNPLFHSGTGALGPFEGIVVTYAGLSHVKGVIRGDIAEENRCMFVVDEIHHAGEEQCWAKDLEEATANREFLVGTSGTLWREDNKRIPFVLYERDEVSGLYMIKCDYQYPYHKAVTDGICREIAWSYYDGSMTWEEDGVEFEASFKDALLVKQQINRMRTALQPHLPLLRDVFRKDWERLHRTRQNYPRAGWLIVASRVASAHVIAEVIQDITGRKPVVAVSWTADGQEASKARDEIERFRNSDDPIIISVKMVSEGVDIDRLTDLTFATNAKTALTFTQLIGRVVRVNEEEADGQIAHVTIPNAEPYVTYAKEIDQEIARAVEEEIERDLEQKRKREMGESTYEAKDAQFAGMQYEYRGATYSDFEIHEAKQFIKEGGELGAFEAARPEKIAELLRRRGREQDASGAWRADDPLYKQVARLKKQVWHLANRVAKKRGIDYREVQEEVNRMFNCRRGKNDLPPIETLEKARDWLLGVAQREHGIDGEQGQSWAIRRMK